MKYNFIWHEMIVPLIKVSLRVPGALWCYFVHSYTSWNEQEVKNGTSGYEMVCSKCKRGWHWISYERQL